MRDQQIWPDPSTVWSVAYNRGLRGYLLGVAQVLRGSVVQQTLFGPFALRRAIATAVRKQQVSEVRALSESTTEPGVKQIVDILSRVLGEVTVNQQATVVAGDGSVQMLMIRYHRALGPHAGASFRTRVASVLDANVPVPGGHWQMQWSPVRNELRMRAEVDQPDDATNQQVSEVE